MLCACIADDRFECSNVIYFTYSILFLLFYFTLINLKLI